MKLKGSIFVLSLFALVSVGAAEKTAESNPACKEDIKKFCKEVKQGEGRVLKCLQDNQNNITVGCKSHLDEWVEVQNIHKSMQAFRTNCKTDIETLCSNVPKGKGRQVKCLQANAEKVSPTCKSTLENEGFTIGAAPAAPGAVTKEGAVATTTEVKTEAKPEANTAAPATPPAAAPATPPAKK